MNKHLLTLYTLGAVSISASLCSASEQNDSAAAVPHSRATPSESSEFVERLNALIVTGTIDPKTAFDLAQGASLLAGEELRLRQQSSLGETLAGIPGVNSTYYGPGSSRPIIRGLGGDRVRMLADSVGSLDLSNISPDHNVSIEPLLVDRIEVLRGPATLLYGSSAVGGVVNVIDNRIPTETTEKSFEGRTEARFSTAANEQTGIVSLSGGDSDYGFQINGLRMISSDVAIPGFAQAGPGAAQDQERGTLPSSAISTKSASLGGAAFWENGNVGLAFSEYDTIYGVPTGDNPPTSIDMEQRRLDLRGAVNALPGPIKALRIRFGYGDYTHSELSGGNTVNTMFKNKAWEGRAELVQESLGNLSGTIGFQFSRTDFSAEGEEVVTPATLTDSAALFVLEEYRLDQLSFQLGGRYERQRIWLSMVNPNLPAFDGFSAQNGEERFDHGASLSAGAVYYPAKSYSVGFSMAASQRLPIAQELFSNGPHGGTAAYEVGRSDLGKEKSLGLDVTLRRRGTAVTGSIGVFANKFRNYIFEQELSDDLKPLTNNPDNLTPYQFVAKDALFYGGEAELEFHLIDQNRERLHVTMEGDYVRAEQTTDHQPLPRIPPLRVGTELRYEHGAWTFGLNERYVFRQNRYTTYESATAGYSLLGVDICYGFGFGRTRYDVFVRGSNLMNRNARVHTSFLKDFAPLPGRNVTFGLRVAF